MGFVTEYDKASLSAGFWLSGLESLACSWMMFGVVVLAEREGERERETERVGGTVCVAAGHLQAQVVEAASLTENCTWSRLRAHQKNPYLSNNI